MFDAPLSPPLLFLFVLLLHKRPPFFWQKLTEIVTVKKRIQKQARVEDSHHLCPLASGLLDTPPWLRSLNLITVDLIQSRPPYIHIHTYALLSCLNLPFSRSQTRVGLHFPRHLGLQSISLDFFYFYPRSLIFRKDFVSFIANPSLSFLDCRRPLPSQLF